MLRPRPSTATGTALVFVLGVWLGLLPGIAPEPQPWADVAFLMWALVLVSAIKLDSPEIEVLPGGEPERRWFEYEGALRGL